MAVPAPTPGLPARMRICAVAPVPRAWKAEPPPGPDVRVNACANRQEPKPLAWREPDRHDRIRHALVGGVDHSAEPLGARRKDDVTSTVRPGSVLDLAERAPAEARLRARRCRKTARRRRRRRSARHDRCAAEGSETRRQVQADRLSSIVIVAPAIGAPSSSTTRPVIPARSVSDLGRIVTADAMRDSPVSVRDSGPVVSRSGAAAGVESFTPRGGTIGGEDEEQDRRDDEQGREGRRERPRPHGSVA